MSSSLSRYLSASLCLGLYLCCLCLCPVWVSLCLETIVGVCAKNGCFLWCVSIMKEVPTGCSPYTRQDFQRREQDENLQKRGEKEGREERRHWFCLRQSCR